MPNQNRVFCSLFCLILGLLCISLVPESGAAEEAELNILCYNVRRCRTDEGKYEYDRFAKIIKKHKPDYISLQELVKFPKQSTGEELAKRLGMHFTFGAAIPLGDGEYGLGILSKEKPLDVKKIEIPSKEEKRLLLLAEFKDCYFAVTHFPLNTQEREHAVSIILDTMLDLKDKPVILSGDFNAEPDEKCVKDLLLHFKALTSLKKPSYPATKPQKVIDYIFALKKGFSYDVVGTETIETKGEASDHLPLYVKVRVSKKGLPS